MRRFGLALGAVSVAADIRDEFEQFKLKFKKTYESAEHELERFAHFVHNVERVAKMKILDPSASYSVMSPMADWPEHEFSKLNTLAVTKENLAEFAEAAKSEKRAKEYQDTQLPAAYDWRENGAVTDVKNQQQCGSCWSFATVANIEGQNYLQNGELVRLSEQELVDCDSYDNGCNGGLPSNAYKDLIANNMGLELESNYPYSAVDGRCKVQRSLERVYISAWVPISQSEYYIAAALVKYGPLAIALNAGYMQLYAGGISDPAFCNPYALDHGVTLVAYGTENGKDWWSIKNSWGPEWGENGYYRIVRGKGACGLNRMVASAIVEKKAAEQYV